MTKESTDASPSEGELRALVSLLEDDNPRVASAVTGRFIELGDSVRNVLQQIVEHGHARGRVRARDILFRLDRQHAFSELEQLAGAEAVDLEDAAVAFCRVHSPTISGHTIRRTLDDLAEQVSAAVRRHSPGQTRIEAFLRGIHDTFGLEGDIRDFHNYDNNFLHTVLARKRGIPISIVLVYQLVGRRLGLDFRTVGAPYKALAWCRDGNFETYIDAFDHGRLWNYQDCADFLRRQGHPGPPFQKYLPILSTRRVIERMTQNMINFAEASGRTDERRAFQHLHGVITEYHLLDVAASTEGRA